MKLYHYMFNVYNPNKRGLIVREEEYLPASAYINKWSVLYNKCQYVVLGNYSKQYINDDDFDVLLKGKYIYMKERNDEKALELFANYQYEKLNKLHEEENNVMKVLEYVKANTFVEG